MSSPNPPKRPKRPERPDRRQSPRLSMSVDVGITSEHNFYSAKTRDISAGGLFIETDVGFPMGARIVVELRLLHTKATVPAEVVWVLLDENGQTEGVGVQFLQLSKQVRERIESFMGLRSAMHVGEVDEVDEEGGASVAPVRKGPPPLPSGH